MVSMKSRSLSAWEIGLPMKTSQKWGMSIISPFGRALPSPCKNTGVTGALGNFRAMTRIPAIRRH